MAAVRIQDVQAVPGQVVYGSLVLDGVRIPLVLAAGADDGPKLAIHCAQHQTEYSGSAMVGPLLADLDLSQVRGTLAIVPLCDIAAIVRTRLPDAYERQYGPMAALRGQLRHNINRTWCGVADGTWVERLSYLVAHEVFAGAAGVLDFHSCRLADPDFTAYLEGHEPSRRLALAFGLKAVDTCPVKGHFSGQCHRQVPAELDVPAILIEMSPTSKLVPWSQIQIARRGVLNVMRHLGMLDGEPELPPVQVVFQRLVPKTVFRSSHLGFAVRYHDEVAVVKAGERVAEVRSLEDFRVLETHRAPADGALASCGPTESCIVLPDEELATFQADPEIIRNT
jgi:predicted deacylase